MNEGLHKPVSCCNCGKNSSGASTVAKVGQVNRFVSLEREREREREREGERERGREGHTHISTHTHMERERETHTYTRAAV